MTQPGMSPHPHQVSRCMTQPKILALPKEMVVAVARAVESKDAQPLVKNQQAVDVSTTAKPDTADTVVAEVAGKLGDLCKQVEEKVRESYPFLLKPIRTVPKHDWALESGCGYGLTADESVFLFKKADSSYMFTFRRR
jgi:hypothetical protein